MGSALAWVFRRLPDTDDAEVRRRVVYTMTGFNLAVLVALIASVLYVSGVRRYEKNLCDSQRFGRVQQAARNDVIRRYLVRHGAQQIADQIVDSPPIDCSTGLVVSRR